MQQLALGARVEQEGITAERERPVQAKLVLRLVMGLPPGYIVILNIQLLTATKLSTVSALCSTAETSQQILHGR